MIRRDWLKKGIRIWCLLVFCLFPLSGFGASDFGVVSFTSGSLTVQESDGKATVQLERTGIAKGDITIRVKSGKASSNTIGGDATEGADFELGTTDISWQSGETGTKRLGFIINSDELVEGDESFSLTIASAGEADIGKISTMTITIKDSTVKPPEPGLINFEPTSYRVKEDAGFVTLSAVRSDGSDGRARIAFTVGGGRSDTATEGKDYTAANGELDWGDGESGRKTFTVKVLEDSQQEDDERLTVSLSRVSGDASIGQFGTAQITIEDTTRVPESGSVQFESSSYRIAEDDGSVSLVVTRTGGSDGFAEAFIALGKNGDSAESGDDYEGLGSVAVRWEDGDSSGKRVNVPIFEDDRVEEDEFFTAIVERVSGASVGEQRETRVTIVNTTEPERNPGSLLFASSSQTAAENAGEIKIRVQRIGGSDGNVSVKYEIGSNNDTATVDQDYKAGSGTLNWNDGDSSDKEITLSLIADNVPEDDESVTIRLFEPTNSATLGNRSTTKVTISDASNFGRLVFDRDAYTVSESDGRVSLIVKRVGGSAGSVSVQVRSGNEGDTAISGQDYTPLSETLRWEQGDSSDKSIEIPVNNDSIFEQDEFLTVTLSAPGGNAQLGEPSAARVTIKNSTPALNGTVQLESASYAVNEEDGRLEVAVTRSGGTDGRISVAYSLGAETDTADPGADYTDDSGVLVWEDGDASAKTIIVNIVSDGVSEPDETLTVVLDDLTGGAEFGSNRAAVVTIAGTLSGDFPIVLEIVSGDQQSGFPGDTLEPFVLSVITEDQSASSGQTVSWSVSPPEAGRLIGGVTTRSDNSGSASNSLEIINGGVITVTARVESAVASRAADDEPNVAQFTVNAGFAGSAGLTNNQRAVGGALDKACNALDNLEAPNPGQADLLATCETLKNGDAGAISSGLNRLQPEELFAVGTLSIDSADLQVTNVQSRINALRAGSHGLDLASLNIELYGQEIPGYVVGTIGDALLVNGSGASSDDPFGRIGVFVNGSVSFGTLDESDNELGLDFDSQSITAGIDYRLSDSIVVGGALGVLTHKGDYNREGGHIELGSTSFSAFATWYNEDKAYVDAIINYGTGSFDFRRRINLVGKPDQFAEGSPNSSELAFSIGAGLEYNNDEWTYGPYGRLSINSAEVDAYNEKASDSSAEGFGSVLAVDSQKIDASTLVFGGQISRTINTGSAVFLPQFRLELEHRLDDSGREITAGFQNDPEQNQFTIEADSVDTDYLNVGFGSSAVFRNGKSGFVFYESRLGQDRLSQHWIKAGFRLEF